MEPGEDDDLENGRARGLEKPVTGMLLLAAYALALILIVGGGMIHRKAEQQAPASIPYAAPPEPMEPAARAALEAFFEAPDLEAKAALVRDGARVRPMMRDFHEKRGHAFPTLGTVSPGQAAEFDGKPMVMFEVEPFSGPRFFVAVVWDGRRFAVDWESLTAYGTMDWIEFTESKPSAAQTMRVYLKEAKVTTPPPDIRLMDVNFQIEHRDHDLPVFAKAGEGMEEKLFALASGRRVPVTLSLEWRDLSPSLRVLWIREIVHEGWSP
jgi:hypothetical protein